MTRITIRKAVISDINQLVKLDEECFYDDKYDKNNWNNLVLFSNVFVAIILNIETNIETIIGVVVRTFISKPYKKKSAEDLFIKKYGIEHYFLIMTICVSSKYRSSGVGSKLLKKAIKIKGKTKDKIILLNVRESNKKAINFYEARGFKTSEFIDKNYYRKPKENALLMYYNQNL